MSSRREQLRALTRQIASALADERVRRHHADEPLATLEEERSIARRVAKERLTGPASAAPWGRPTLSDPDERALIEEAIAGVLGLGRLEPLLEDEEITDIHIRGNCPVWVKMRDGSRSSVGPLVDTDEELVEFIRRIATRMCARETRFDGSLRRWTSPSVPR
jgi:hypothetical protein